METERYSKLREGEKGAWLSLVAYLCLSLMKLSTGYLAGSEALVADGWNNTTDILVTLAVLIGLRVARKPPDRDHRYGHFRAESIAALVASIVMIAVGVQVIYRAVRLFLEGAAPTPESPAMWMAAIGALVMYGVYRYNLRLAQRTQSQAVLAAAQDNRSDALVSVGALIGIVGARWGLPWLDPAAALLVGVVICRTAWQIFSDATHALSDGFDHAQLRELKTTIQSTPGVENVSDIRARVHGANVLVDVTIQVDGRLNLVESHDISDEVERRMLEEHRIDHVHVHVEPAATLK